MFHYALLLDDHRIILDGLSDLLSQKARVSVECASTTKARLESFIASDKMTAPQKTFAVVDLSMNGEYSYDVIQQLASRNVKVIVYSMHESVFYVRKSFEAGAYAYVFKSAPSEDLLSAIADYLFLGLSNKEIAQKLNITVRTLENNLKNMYDKSFTDCKNELIKKLSGAE